MSLNAKNYPLSKLFQVILFSLIHICCFTLMIEKISEFDKKVR